MHNARIAGMLGTITHQHKIGHTVALTNVGRTAMRWPFKLWAIVQLIPAYLNLNIHTNLGP